jgi:hypothetical protein
MRAGAGGLAAAARILMGREAVDDVFDDAPQVAGRASAEEEAAAPGHLRPPFEVFGEEGGGLGQAAKRHAGAPMVDRVVHVVEVTAE